jgi:RNA-directed DNA polymerase
VHSGLSVPTVADRVVQTAARLVLEAIFEADLPSAQYAYRPRRSAHQAVQAVRELVRAGHTEVVDADLSNYFGTLPHAELVKSVARRVSDGAVLHLLKMWLVAPVEERDARGRRTRTTAAKDTGRGTTQGAPLSPLLANLYMRRFILAWQQRGLETQLDAHIVSYADDLVICCRGTGPVAYAAMQALMGRLKLTVNAAKSSLRRVPADSVDFLGYTIGRCYSPRTGWAYIATYPSKKAVRHVCTAIREATQRRWLWRAPEELVADLNRVLVGWANYFCLGPVSKAYRAVDHHARWRLRRWLRVKHKVPGKGFARLPDQMLYEQYGLVALGPRTRDLPWAKAR